MPEPTTDAARDRLHSAIMNETASLGPHELDDEGDPVPDRPLPNATLEEWVLVASWRDPATGRTIISRTISRGLPRHHENGLLHEALYDFD